MISTNELKNGYVIDVDGVLSTVVEFQHVKPGKGGAFVRTKLKNLATGAVVDKTFRAGEKLPRVTTMTRNMQYLYEDGTDLVLMDNETYEQIHFPAAMWRTATCSRRTPSCRCCSSATSRSAWSCRSRWS